jgi:hypothetical protein
MIKYELLILIAIFAFVYSNILTQPSEILSGVYRKLYVFFNSDNRIMNGKQLHPLFKVLIHCEKCIAGQLALWFTLFGSWFEILINENYLDVFIKVFLSITFTILTTITIKGIYNKYIKHE